jgi:hypothetical protein
MKRLVLLSSIALLLSSSAAMAAASFDVAVGLKINENSRIFLNVANETWHPAEPTAIVRRCSNPEDDFPVISYLAYQSHRSPQYILSLRQMGYGWSDIFFHLNVSPRVLFAGIDRDPGPPFGKAWGYWQNEHRTHYSAKSQYRLSDRDVVALVRIQTAARHFGTNAYAVMDARDGGRRADVYAANRWRERNHRDTWYHPGEPDRHHRRNWDQGDERDRDHRRGGDQWYESDNHQD